MKPAELYSRLIGDKPSPQQDGKDSDAHRCSEGVGITPNWDTEAEITDRAAVHQNLAGQKKTTKKTLLAAQNGKATPGSTIKKEQEQAKRLE